MDHKRIDEEIKQTLRGFEQTEQAKLAPYFYTRLSTKLEVERRR